MNHITIEELLKAGAHFGHPTSRWNPKFKNYITMRKLLIIFSILLSINSYSQVTATFELDLSLYSGTISNVDVSSSAAIGFSKMENLTSNKALYSNSYGDVTPSLVTSTELGYLDGATSNIQTQLNSISTSPWTTSA